MPKKKMDTGSWLFIAGIVLAIITALITLDPMVMVILIILGLIVGYLNVSDKDSLLVMVSILVIAFGTTALSLLPGIGTVLTSILQNIAAFAWPVGIVVAFRTFYERAGK